MSDERVCVVTGAASGIGRSTALAFAKRGALLELVDWNANGLEETRRLVLETSGRVPGTRVLDVGDGCEVRAYAAQVAARHSGVDVLVNSAGVAFVGDFVRTDSEHWEEIFRVNVLGVVHGVRAFLGLLSARRGQIVNVASAAAFFTPGTLGAYGASKHALVGMSQALRWELAPRGVGVTIVCPGLVATPLAEHLTLPKSDEGERTRLKALLHRAGCSPDRVAEAIVNSGRRRPALLTVGFDAAALRWLSRIAPWAIPRLAREVASRHTVRDIE
jgi:NAD(P)-dependent dehydrogenase (short-subunit alcohol dehydrogenase family)